MKCIYTLYFLYFYAVYLFGFIWLIFSELQQNNTRCNTLFKTCEKIFTKVCYLK